MCIQMQVNQIGFPYRFHNEIALRRKIQEKFNRLCESFNSLEIEIPLIEPLNSIIGNPPKPLREYHLNLIFHGLVFFDNMSITSAVRYEASESIAKIAAMQKWQDKTNLLFHYMQEMVRLENSSELCSTRHRAFFQMGHERFTIDPQKNIENIAYEIKMIISFFDELKIKGCVRVSHVHVLRHGLQSPEINSILRNRLTTIFEKASKEEALEILSRLSLTENLHEFLKKVLEFRHVPLSEGINLMNDIPELCHATKELRSLIQAINCLGIPEKSVIFDAGIHRSLGFYSGLVFQADVVGISEVAGGGDFSSIMRGEMHCSGFAIGYERIAASLKQQYQEQESEQMNDSNRLLQTV